MEEIFYISKSNSIPFAKREVSNYRTEENSLTFEGKQNLSERDYWYFKPNEKATIQIQSNLSNIKGVVYKDSVLQEEFNADLKIENINQNITLDCEVVDLLDTSNRGLKFTNGNIYDNSTDLNVIDTYSIAGSLPDFTRTDENIIGKLINIDSTDYEILSIVYDETESSWCIEIDSASLTLGTAVMSLDYDIEKFNIYEITFDFQNYNNSELIILIEAETTSTTLYQVSETLKIGFFEGMIDILYKGNSDKDIFYSTGIKNILRISYDKITPYTIDENENQKNDNSAYLIDSQTNEGNEFAITPISFKKYRQLVLALNHPTLFIDSIGYVIDGSVTKEDNEETNLVDVTFKCIRAFSEKENKREYNKTQDKVDIQTYFTEDGGLIVEDNYIIE